MTDGAEADDGPVTPTRRAPIKITVLVADAGLHIRNHYMPTQAYRSALEAAGFTDVVIRDPEISREALPAHESGSRNAMIDRPVFSLIDCRKT